MTAPSQEEWLDIAADFPSLNRANVLITGPETPTYNCIAYSLGRTDIWINPPRTLPQFEGLYNGAPYSHPTKPAGAPDAHIDGWANPPVGPSITEMRHGSKVYGPNPALWESKLGASYRITHGRDELTSTLYGRIVTSFD